MGVHLITVPLQNRNLLQNPIFSREVIPVRQNLRVITNIRVWCRNSGVAYTRKANCGPVAAVSIKCTQNSKRRDNENVRTQNMEIKSRNYNSVTRHCCSTLTVTVVKRREINFGNLGKGYSVVFKVQY